MSLCCLRLHCPCPWGSKTVLPDSSRARLTKAGSGLPGQVDTLTALPAAAHGAGAPSRMSGAGAGATLVATGRSNCSDSLLALQLPTVCVFTWTCWVPPGPHSALPVPTPREEGSRLLRALASRLGSSGQHWVILPAGSIVSPATQQARLALPGAPWGL